MYKESLIYRTGSKNNFSNQHLKRKSTNFDNKPVVIILKQRVEFVFYFKQFHTFI